MDLNKIGKYIAKKRQEKGFTQESLAEKLDISNRSISKWERGICLPDANNMAKLCKLFGISYNEFLSGEDINQKDYQKFAEQKLEDFSKIETAQNKKFLMYENVIGSISTAACLILVFAGSFIDMNIAARIILIVLGFAILITNVRIAATSTCQNIQVFIWRNISAARAKWSAQNVTRNPGKRR